MRLYHFIAPTYALQAVGLRRLKVSRIDQLNDPFEMLAGTQSEPVSRATMRAVRDAFSRHVGILCMSRDWHSPVLWSHYADRHRGLCLGFDVDDTIAMPVKYVPKRVSFDHCFDPATTEEEVRALAGSLAATKFSHWRYEKEVRCWAPLDPCGPEVQYFYFGSQIKLRSIYIGAKSAIRRRSIFDALGDDLTDHVKVVTTRLAFRSFRVVTQRDRSLWT